MQNPVVFPIDEGDLSGPRMTSDRFVFSVYFKPLSLTPLPEPTTPEIEFDNLEQLLRSELGHLMLDRTRISPAGFALGEHLHSLSLAPGEEVVLEQRTFSKRETTFEDQTEEEEQFDLELSSTLTTELSEGLDRENRRTDTTNTQVGGSAGGQVEGIPVAEGVTAGANVKVDASYARNLVEANSQIQRRSVKESSTASRKIASKYRVAHKTTFKVSTESRFESSSKRVIRNPNQFSPLDVHYFKILRRLELVQERYGVRLCWAPAVKDPARGIRERIAKERAEIMDAALRVVELPDKPAEPVPETRLPKVVTSATLKVPDEKWGWVYDMSEDFELAVPIPKDYVWDGDVEQVRQATQVWATAVDRDWGWNLQGDPWVDGTSLIVKIHVGVDWKKPPVGRRGDIHLMAGARFIGDPAAASEEYKQAYAAWKVELAKWEAEVERRLAAPRAAAKERADSREAELVDALEPAAELVDRVVGSFSAVQTDEPWEIEFWGQVFEWDRAGYSLYPAWWTQAPTRDWSKSATDFTNASWAKLYVPVKPGMERFALRWIVGKSLGTPLDDALEAAFARIDGELKKFRTASFGDQYETRIGKGEILQEQVLTLGRWSELLPTDGTHVEVVQGRTTAVDDHSGAEITSLRALRAWEASNEEQDVELKKRAVAHIGGNRPPLNVNVEIATEPGASNHARA